jgi:hypothetical protein
MDNINLGMTMDEVVVAYELDESRLEGIELATTKITRCGTFNIVDFISLHPNYYFYKNNLVGVFYFIYGRFLRDYDLEYNSYEENKMVYNYFKDTINEKYGNGIEIDNCGVNDDKTKDVSDMATVNRKEIKQISLTHWKINENDLFLKLILCSDGESYKYIIFGNNFFLNGYPELVKKEFKEGYEILMKDIK